MTHINSGATRAQLRNGLARKEIIEALEIASKITGRTIQIADQSNIFKGGEGHDFRLDYSAFKRQLSGDTNIASYAVVSASPTKRPSQDAFYRYLHRIGWIVHRFQAVRHGDVIAENEAFVDGHVRDLIHAAANNPQCNSIVLLAGDGGYTDVVRYAQFQGKRVYVIAWANTLHHALMEAATGYATIEELQPLIARQLH